MHKWLDMITLHSINEVDELWGIRRAQTSEIYEFGYFGYLFWVFGVCKRAKYVSCWQNTWQVSGRHVDHFFHAWKALSTTYGTPINLKKMNE